MDTKTYSNGVDENISSVSKRKTDRRVSKTRRLLTIAVYNMLPKVSWQDTSVSLICSEAGISRSTFYTHFNTKEELLEAVLEDLLIRLSTSVNEERGLDHNGTFRFVEKMFDNVQVVRRVMNRQHNDVYSFELVHKFLKLVHDAMKLEINESTQRGRLKTKNITMLSAALGAQIKQWLDNACRQDKKIVLENFDTFAKSVLFDDLGSSSAISLTVTH